MDMLEAIYGYDKRIAGVLRRIRSSDICDENKQKLEEFYRFLTVHGFSKARIDKYLNTLYTQAKWLGKQFVAADKTDIENVVQRLECSGYAGWTKRDFKVILKVFFRWLRGAEDYPEEVRWIKNHDSTKIMLPEELLTKEEAMRMVEAAETVRDKAFILTLYETGCRIGEILTLQIKHVQFDAYGAVLLVNGKTGQRRIRVIASAPKLGQWIENHPMSGRTDSPLWITWGTNSRYRPFSYGLAKDTIRKIAAKAGIRKRVHPHLFRHSRATSLANHLTEAQMKQYFGWVQASDMASTYVHLSGRDVDGALLRLNGINVPEETGAETLKVLTCPRCKGNNSPDAKFCSRCGMCLDEKTAVEIDETRMKADALMTELVKRPEILEQMLHAIEAIVE